MLTRSLRVVIASGALACTSWPAAFAAAQAGYPAPPQQPAYPQQYQQPAPAQPVAPQPAQPAYSQPAYQQPAPQPAPAPVQQPAPAPQPAPAQQPVPGQPAYGQPAPAQPPYAAQPAPAPEGYPAPTAQYPQFPVPPPDNTQPPSQGAIPDGTVQLGLTTTFVRYEPLHVSFDNDAIVERDVSTLSWGIEKNPIALEIGYGLTEQLVFGGTLGLGGSSQTIKVKGQADQDSSSFGFEFGPKLDFMFSPGATVNPFIGAQALVRLDSEDSGGGTEDSDHLFIFLARFGLRAFLTDRFSIDPALVVGGGFGSGKVSDNTGDVDFDLSGFRIGLNLGISGWLG